VHDWPVAEERKNLQQQNKQKTTQETRSVYEQIGRCLSLFVVVFGLKLPDRHSLSESTYFFSLV
jgi:hypothetical protein